MNRGLSGLAVLTWLLTRAGPSGAQSPQTPPQNLATALAGLAERAQQYYDRISSIICIETVTQQELKSNLTPVGKPRVTVYELSVTRDTRPKGDPEFHVERTLQMVNGKRARRNEEPGCTDPKTGTPEPLGFLLAKNQRNFKFSLSATAAGGPAGTVALDFVQAPPDRVDVKWKGNCFNAEGGGEDGRLWFEPGTFDVLQIAARLPKPFLIMVPSFGLSNPPIRVERSNVTMRFGRVRFEQPDETVLLPESTETATVFRGAPSWRIVQKLSNFRRFLSVSTVRPATR